MTKRIAIQLFGHLRTFEYTFEMFKKNVLEANSRDGYEVDIFIHTWDELDHSTVSYRNPDGEPLTDKTLLPSDIDMAKKLYQPKGFSIQPQRQHEEILIDEKIGHFKRSIKGCVNMAYTLYSSSELRREYEQKNNVKYDWVIVTRPDVLFKYEFRIEDFLKSHRDFKFEIPQDGLFYAFNPFGRENKIEEPQFLTGADLIYFATPDNVDKATSLYSKFEENIDVNNFYCMEVWWGGYWRSQGLKPYPILYRHGPEFEIIKTNQIPNPPQEKTKEYTKAKFSIFSMPIIKYEKERKDIFKLFNLITLLKIKKYPHKKKYYLLGFIYILKERTNV